MRLFRRIWTPIASQVRAHLRGPLVALLLLAFLVLGAGLPLIGEPGSADRLRHQASLVTSTAGILLMLVACGLPVASARARRRMAPGRLGSRGQALVAFGGHGLVLLLVGCMLGLASLLLVTLMVRWPDAPEAPTLAREVLAAAPAAERMLVRGGKPLVLESRVPPQARGMTLRLAPLVRLREGERPGPGGVLDSRLEVLWRQGEAPWRRSRGALRRGRPTETRLALDAAGSREVEVRVRLTSPGLALAFAPGDAVLVGGRSGATGALIRAVLVHALAALGLLAFTQWLSGFVAYPLAVAGALTAALAGGTVELADWQSLDRIIGWLPGVALDDPAARLGVGLAPGWDQLLREALRSGGWGLIAVLCALRQGRRGDEG